MHTLCKDLNIKQNNAQAWLKREDYYYELEPFELESFRGSFGFPNKIFALTISVVAAKSTAPKQKEPLNDSNSKGSNS